MALDLPPASMGAVDVRNLSAMSRLSLPRLISLGSLAGYEAALMLDSLDRGDPVLIFGRTGVGKTTLSNALLASLPRHWRIVSVEEVREIEDLTRYGMHHTPYEITSSKLDFIKFLLHRNPDLVFLGEILGREHAEALDLTSFSGLKVMATTHAKDYRSLIQKWSSWGVSLPEGTLAVRMEEKRVVEMRRWVDGGWDDPGGPSTDWLMHVKRLEGAETNEEVYRRIKGLLEES
ncbi:MAG: ATPase, T2SS/T4P/T4SS family, partial [Candidatus Korarchaeota archaeon]|nr:ATPase, T2SS/T4P/T4SS family [Candidatus Korarchaeota archaeon]